MTDNITLTDRYDDVLKVTDEGDQGVEFIADDNVTDFLFDEDAVRRLRNFLDDILGDDEDRKPETATEAVLSVAAEHGLRAKFSYTGDEDYGVARDRRIEVESVWDAHNGHTLVGGESYDDLGRHEGYRQFRLDRINGPVVVR